jgi:hypothetical protein
MASVRSDHTLLPLWTLVPAHLHLLPTTSVTALFAGTLRPGRLHGLWQVIRAQSPSRGFHPLAEHVPTRPVCAVQGIPSVGIETRQAGMQMALSVRGGALTNAPEKWAGLAPVCNQRPF